MTRPAEVRLDTSHPHERDWTLAASSPRMILRCDGPTNLTRLSDAAGGVLRTWTDPLEALAWAEQEIRHARTPTGARWVGYLSYDLGRLFERLPSIARDDLRLPLFAFGFVEPSTDQTSESIATSPNAPSPPRPKPAALGSTFSRDEYLRGVARCIEFIRAGDVFQVNLSQRFSTTSHETVSTIYARLLAAAPARYGALLDFGDHALICNSPELFLRVVPGVATGPRRILTRPIKGTRPLAPGMAEELLRSAKDQAELNMIVDLERNDLGRVCRVGSVKVTEPRTIERHPTVYHGIATIEGVLRDHLGFVDLLRATFPGGSVTGAPKIRAMEIIDGLEPVRRGPYCGAVGYLAADGRIEFNVAIRTMIVKGDRVHIPVGGGIVADSDPADEYEETLVKARAMLAALGMEPASAAAATD